MTFLAASLVTVGATALIAAAARTMRAAPDAHITYRWRDDGLLVTVGVLVAAVGGVLLQRSIGWWARLVFLAAAMLPRLALTWRDNHCAESAASQRSNLTATGQRPDRRSGSSACAVDPID